MNTYGDLIAKGAKAFQPNVAPKFMNGYWRAVVNGCIQPLCYNTREDAASACK